MMPNRTIHITEYDLTRLRELIRAAGHTDYRGSEYLDQLTNELNRAKIVATEEVPPDVVTMNSKVRLEDVDTGEEMVFTLVFPEEADIPQDKISVLAPIGTAMLGYRVGDTFEWQVPAGLRRIKVKEILYQPKSSSD
jgi:regulator of nucleoside diphosphate kinase